LQQSEIKKIVEKKLRERRIEHHVSRRNASSSGQSRGA
jgi:hypothetical protein